MPYYTVDSPPRSAGRRPLLVVLALFAAILGAVAWHWVQGGEASSPTGVRLGVLSGSARLTHDEGAPTDLDPGAWTALAPGDEVTLSAAGSARLTFGESALELGPGTRTMLLEREADTLGRVWSLTVALQGGRAAALVGEGATLTLATNVATFTCGRGRFGAEVAEAGRALLTVHEGEATVAMGEQTLTLSAGQYVEALLGQPLQARASTAAAGPAATSVWSYWDESNRTLFPPALTPTRPGDAPAATAPPPAGGEAREDVAGDGTYVVQPGDTLFAIAQRYGIPWERLWEANKAALPRPEMLAVGQVLRIP